MRVAAIDVGTNTALLLVAERREDGTWQAVDERMEITRLGRGVDGTRRLDPRAIADTVAAIGRFAEAARAAGAEALVVTATSAARDASNGEEFLEAAERATGARPEILGGDEEAEASFASARVDYGSGPLAMVDIGGGSTELVYGDDVGVGWRRSFDVGAVRLTERMLHSDPPTDEELRALRHELRTLFSQAPKPPEGARLVGIAGTVTTLCAISLGLDAYDGRLVHGRVLDAATVRELAGRLAASTLEERKRIPGLPEKRADVIVAGAEILAVLMETLGFSEVHVSDRGVRWGLLYQRFG